MTGNPSGDTQAHGHEAPGSPGTPRRALYRRLEALFWGLACVGMLAAPRLVTPDPRGYGTHEQLFMVPCLFRAMTTLPCPFCGMTTSFAHLTRGHVAAAIRAHPGGPLLYVVLATTAAYCLIWAATGWNPLHGRMGFLVGARFILPALGFFWALALIARFA